MNYECMHARCLGVCAANYSVGQAYSLLHVLLRLEHVDLPLPLQLVLILGPVPLVLRLGIERLARLLGLLLDVGAAHLLGVGVHLGPLGGCLVLLGRACVSACVGKLNREMRDLKICK